MKNIPIHIKIQKGTVQNRIELIRFSQDDMVINMGPHHPSTHGVIRIVLRVDGEYVSEARPDIGYLHRGIEKIAESMSYQSFMPYTDRIDYVSSINCNIGYAEAVEKLGGIIIPPRASYIRIITAELNRILSHLLGVGSLSTDLGAFTPFIHAVRERENIYNLLEAITGARLTYNFARIGGVARDISDEVLKKIDVYIDTVPSFIAEYQRLLGKNKIYIERLKDIGVISDEDALTHSLSGPNLRASGISFDIRKHDPYLSYPDFNFDVPLGEIKYGTIGDSYNRYMVRINEILESVKIIKQALSKIPSGEIQEKVPKKFVIPKGEIYSRTEAPRGELGFYLESDGKTDGPSRLKIRTGSFSAMTILSHKIPGMMIADVVAFFSSLDVVAPEVDR